MFIPPQIHSECINKKRAKNEPVSHTILLLYGKFDASYTSEREELVDKAFSQQA